MDFQRCDECRSDCTDHCFAENARSVGMNRVPGGGRGRVVNGPVQGIRQPQWEGGSVGEYRSDGSYMPFLNPDGSRMTVKQKANMGSRTFEKRRRDRLRNSV